MALANKQRENKTPPRSPGRPKGSPNKTTALLKDAILRAAELAGDGDMTVYLATQARVNPGPFMALLGKVLPLQIAGEGKDGALIVEIVKRTYSENSTPG